MTTPENTDEVFRILIIKLECDLEKRWIRKRENANPVKVIIIIFTSAPLQKKKDKPLKIMYMPKFF